MVASFKIKYLSKANKPYFISEIGINHNGRLGLALEMVKKSKMAGFDAVKFQKRDVKDLLNFNYKIEKGTGYLSKNKNDIPKKSVKFGNWVYPDERLELNQTDYNKIKKLCKKLKIDLIVSPWDEKSVDFLCKLGVKAIKIASIDANNYHFCEYIAKKKIPIVLSTGFGSKDEIIKLKETIENYKE